MTNKVTSDSVETIFQPLPSPKWKYTLANPASGGPNTYYCQSDGPNWFHRLMQRWLLGIYWERSEY